MGKMISPFCQFVSIVFNLWVCLGRGVYVNFWWRPEIHVMWYLLPPHFLIHSFSLNMGLTLPDKTSWLANLSDPPASLPSTRIELLCWAFYSGTRDLSSGLWLAWKSLTELSPLSTQLHLSFSYYAANCWLVNENKFQAACLLGFPLACCSHM